MPPTTERAGCRRLGLRPDSEQFLAELVLGADEGAMRDLRDAVLAPLEDQGDSSTEKLTETLRSWLLHHGRREAVAAELSCTPRRCATGWVSCVSSSVTAWRTPGASWS